jgi:hypothetical protein
MVGQTAASCLARNSTAAASTNRPRGAVGRPFDPYEWNEGRVGEKGLGTQTSKRSGIGIPTQSGPPARSPRGWGPSRGGRRIHATLLRAPATSGTGANARRAGSDPSARSRLGWVASSPAPVPVCRAPIAGRHPRPGRNAIGNMPLIRAREGGSETANAAAKPPQLAAVDLDCPAAGVGQLDRT